MLHYIMLHYAKQTYMAAKLTHNSNRLQYYNFKPYNTSILHAVLVPSRIPSVIEGAECHL